jgi:hypothetical protein
MRAMCPGMPTFSGITLYPSSSGELPFTFKPSSC